MSEKQLEKPELQEPTNTTKNAPESSDENDGRQLEKPELQNPTNTTKNALDLSDENGASCPSLENDALPQVIQPRLDKQASCYQGKQMYNNNNEDATHTLQKNYYIYRVQWGFCFMGLSENQKFQGLNCQNLQIGSNNTMNIFQEKKEITQKKKIDEEQLKVYLNSTNKVAKENLQQICKHLGNEWRSVGRVLGIDDAELDAIHFDFSKDGLKEICYQMLRTWFEKNPSQCTVGNLARALQGCDKDDVILQLQHDK